MKLDSSYSTYKQNDANCSQPQLIVILYDAAIRFTREAANHMMAGRWAEKGVSIEASYECIAELRRTLNMKDGGEVAAALDKMYDLLLTKLTLGNVEKDVDQFYQVIQSLETLRTAWVEVFEKMKQDGHFVNTELPETYAVAVK